MDTIPLCFVAALLSTLVLFLLSGHRHRHRHRNLLLPPTISGAVPILGHLHLLMGARHRKEPLHRTLTALSAAHGPVLLLRFGSRPVLSISSPSAAEDCLTINDITFLNRPPLLATKYLGLDGSTLATASYGPLWRILRRIATVELFSTARIQSFANFRAEEILSLLRSLSSAAAINTVEWTPAELNTKFKTLTFSTMMRILDGRKYYGEEKTVNSEVGERFRRMIEELLLLSGVSSVEDFLPWMGWLGMGRTKRRIMRLAKEMDEIFQEMVDERRRRRSAVKAEAAETEKTEKTIVDVMLALQEQEPDKYSDLIIKGMISNIIVAGTDTSAIAMEWALSLLLNHPKALQKARDEIDSHIGGGHGRLITDSDLPHLRYLQNIIKETLRLFPPGPLLLPHQSSADCTVAGYTIPSGTILLINAYAIHRDPTMWKDADSFRPERFDEGEGEGFHFFPFGSGRRRCPAEALAYRLMGLAVGALIQCFEWKRVNGDETVDLTEGEGLSMPKLVPLQALYKPREVMLPLLSQL